MRFDPIDGSKPTQSTVKTGTLATPPEQNPQRQGFRFDGWTLDGQPFDFRTPILQDTTLKAQWTKTTDWRLSPDHGPASGARLTISPPSPQEPYYTNIQAAGNEIVGLTGDGRIYTWTQDNTPEQVPSPAQAPDGFHYLQVAAGSRRQAALGSDQQIYTWASGQATPTILDTSKNTKFTSISINDNRLMAVDRQGQVHTYQASQKPNPKLIEQAATSLPGKTQAVTAIASATRILALDSDGQAWIWDTANTGSAKPERVRQDATIRIIQAQALNQGFLLLNADGHAYHLADSMTSLTAVNLPESMKASSATTNTNQAMITGKDGHVWAWKPGEAPKRADKAGQQFVQATAAGNRITAISRQGDIYKWSLDEQGQPGKPARLDTVSEPTLDTVSMDGQPLTLSKKERSWQAEIPAHKPGPATITITGRQDGQPFIRSLTYTIDQILIRDTETETGYSVHFNTDGGHPEPGYQQVSYPYGRVQRPSPDPSRDGYQFDGWFTGEVAYDFSKPVTENLTLTAHWTFKDQNNQWKISPDKGNQLGNETITITPPDTSRGIRFNQVSGSKDTTYGFSLAVGSDGNAYAWGLNNYGQLGDGTRTNRTTPVIVKKPDRTTYPDLPDDFTYVQVSAGGRHSLALGSDGYVYAWGDNSNGRLGNNTTSPSYAPVRVHDPGSPTDASKGLQAIQVSAGSNHSLAVGSNGYAYAWGLNNYGQLGNNSYKNSYAPVLVRDPNSFSDASKGLQAIQVSGGDSHSLAVGSDGYAYAWGYNSDYGQLGNNSYRNSYAPVLVRDPSSPTDAGKGLKALQVSAGVGHSLAVGSDGYAYAWGWNSSGQLGNNKSSDSTFPVQVHNPNSPSDSSKGLQALQVSAGFYHSLAVGSDGYAYAWGGNNNGQLGDNSRYSSYAPALVHDSSNPDDTSKGLKAVQANAGFYHSLAVGSDGYAYAWGVNGSGQLGNGATSQSNVPVPTVFNLTPVISAVRFDRDPSKGLTRGDNNSVTVLTPEHQPGKVIVSVDYTQGGAGSIMTDTSLRYTYLPAGVLPRAGGEGILLALATGMTGMGGVLASRHHRRELHRLLHTSHE